MVANGMGSLVTESKISPLVSTNVSNNLSCPFWLLIFFFQVKSEALKCEKAANVHANIRIALEYDILNFIDRIILKDRYCLFKIFEIIHNLSEWTKKTLLISRSLYNKPFLLCLFITAKE
jgi:hypothetical protein